ncbi:efflux RND transporter permease subunit, partial [Achromobacter sp. GbtcB20]|uniref:efflux RND transporter permease subunit n=1 Tax=Achromobacter sp. GbtcB20 TaxID=2824765 RepID=UPI001C2F9E35
FGRIVLRANPDGSCVCLADVARLEVGRQGYDFETRLNGKKAVGAAVQLAPGANATDTVKAVNARLKELSASYPEDIAYSVPFDTSKFVSVAITKVVHTLLEAMVLV